MYYYIQILEENETTTKLVLPLPPSSHQFIDVLTQGNLQLILWEKSCFLAHWVSKELQQP